MIKRLIIELTEPLCDCPAGTQLALDMETAKKDGSYDLQVSCTACKIYISMPLKKLRALIKMTDDEITFTQALPNRKEKPKLVLLQGGAASVTTKEAS